MTGEEEVELRVDEIVSWLVQRGRLVKGCYSELAQLDRCVEQALIDQRSIANNGTPLDRLIDTIQLMETLEIKQFNTVRKTLFGQIVNSKLKLLTQLRDKYHKHNLHVLQAVISLQNNVKYDIPTISGNLADLHKQVEDTSNAIKRLQSSTQASMKRIEKLCDLYEIPMHLIQAEDWSAVSSHVQSCAILKRSSLVAQILAMLKEPSIWNAINFYMEFLSTSFMWCGQVGPTHVLPCLLTVISQEQELLSKSTAHVPMQENRESKNMDDEPQIDWNVSVMDDPDSSLESKDEVITSGPGPLLLDSTTWNSLIIDVNELLGFIDQQADQSEAGDVGSTVSDEHSEVELVVRDVFELSRIQNQLRAVLSHLNGENLQTYQRLAVSRTACMRVTQNIERELRSFTRFKQRIAQLNDRLNNLHLETQKLSQVLQEKKVQTHVLKSYVGQQISSVFQGKLMCHVI